MLYVAVTAIFVSVATLAYLALETVFAEERQVTRRLRRMSDFESSQAREMEPLLQPFQQRVIRPIGKGVSAFAHMIAPAGYIKLVRERLVRAGAPRSMGAERLVAVKVLSALAVLAFFFAVSRVADLSAAAWTLLVVPLVAVAYFGPDAWLSSRISRRQLEIRRSLPDMLDMLTISVEAGLGFDAAIAKLVRNSEGPLATEFARVLQEVQAGVDRSDALRNMAERTDVSELNAFITAIIQAEIFGISVSSVLRTQARDMRVKRRQFAEEQAQKAPVKMVFPLVLFILPATLIVILGPAVMSIIGVFG